MASPPPPELIPDAVAEILLRLTPEDPAGLVRASAVCKPWLRTLTDPAFLRRYRAFHGTSRVLGFLHNPIDRRRERFVPTTALRPHAAAHRTCVVIDCRHGRALLYDYGSGEFVVWDPVTGRERRIPDEAPDVCTHHSVLCAAGPGCDHSTCGGGPFLLASVGVHCGAIYEDEENEGMHCFAYGCCYSSETGETSAQTDLYLEHEHNQCFLDGRPTVLVGGALYLVEDSGKLLRYDLLDSGCAPPTGH
jgi:hypothetical protein